MAFWTNVLEYEYDYLAFWTNVLVYEYDNLAFWTNLFEYEYEYDYLAFLDHCTRIPIRIIVIRKYEYYGYKYRI